MPTAVTLDSTTVVALDDGRGPFFDPREAAFPDATAELWRRADARDPAAVQDGAWWLQFRCFAFRPPGGDVVLVDTGIGPATAPARSWAPVPGQLPAELEAAGIAPADVNTVILTHLHTDHVGWSLDATGEPYFGNARYLLQRTELEAIGRQGAMAEWLIDPLRRSGQLSVADGEVSLGGNLRVVPTPGHTPGHQSVLLETPDGTVVATGDLLVHMVQLLDPEISYAHEMDAGAARTSRVTLLHELSRRGRVVLATPHLSEPFVPLGDLGYKVL